MVDILHDILRQRRRIALRQLHADGLALVANQHGRRRYRQLRQFTRLVDRGLQIADLIDQAALQRLLPGPDPPAADGINFGDAALAALGHARQELLILVFDAVADQLALRIAEGIVASDQVGIIAAQVGGRD